jgi:hypothetical protein
VVHSRRRHPTCGLVAGATRRLSWDMARGLSIGGCAIVTTCT